MTDPHGFIEAIHIAASHGEIPHAVPMAVARTGRGLEGDRNFDDPDPESCDITLIEAEVLERLGREHGLNLLPGASRRQVLVRGTALGDFIGRRFEIGEIECVGEERCEPCNHLVGLVGTPVVLKGLLHSGLRARITRGGTIRVGDRVRLVGEKLVAS
jgi:MOSC domain-containing protein YiiM